MIKLEKLLFFIQKGYNVLFEGEHGVGKTAMVKEAFNAAGLKWAYFSGATMDPYIDFCGVPVKIGDGDGSYIELIKPKHLATNEIQALFFDEFNRSHKKVRNAVMELIQFGTINGQPFSKELKVVWAAINPETEDDTYDVEPMDPAQKDRFHVHLQIPYECSLEYFCSVYGDEVGKAAVQYWKSLPESQKRLVSPRRLDFALKTYGDGGDVRDIIPKSSNPGRLTSIIKIGPAETKLESMMKDATAAKAFLADENNYLHVLKTILGQQRFIEFFCPLMPPEKMAILYSSEAKIRNFMKKDIRKNKSQSAFAQPLTEVATANQNHAVASKIKKCLAGAGIASDALKIHFAGTKNDEWREIQSLEKRAGFGNGSYHNRMQTLGWTYKDFEKLIGPNPTKEVVAAGLSLIGLFCSSASYGKLKKIMPELDGLINHLLVCVLRHGGTEKSLEDVYKKHPKIKWFRTRLSGSPDFSDILMYHNYRQTQKTMAESKAAERAKKNFPPPAVASAPAVPTANKTRTSSEVTDPGEMEAIWKAYKGNGGNLSFEAIEKDPSFGLKLAKGNSARRVMLKWAEILKRKTQSPNVTKMFSVA